jgi:hypothetical protein
MHRPKNPRSFLATLDFRGGSEEGDAVAFFLLERPKNDQREEGCFDSVEDTKLLSFRCSDVSSSNGFVEFLRIESSEGIDDDNRKENDGADG